MSRSQTLRAAYGSYPLADLNIIHIRGTPFAISSHIAFRPVSISNQAVRTLLYTAQGSSHSKAWPKPSCILPDASTQAQTFLGFMFEHFIEKQNLDNDEGVSSPFVHASIYFLAAPLWTNLRIFVWIYSNNLLSMTLTVSEKEMSGSGTKSSWTEASDASDASARLKNV